MDAIVLGLAYGDEGKGITVDFLSRNVADSEDAIVVRFSGGPQCGHTVKIGGTKHVFASFGSGTFRGLPTYISHHCCISPPHMLVEDATLRNKYDVQPFVYVHPLARLITPADVMYGRLREEMMRHGSCGKGVGAAMSRHEGTPYKVFAVDLTDPAILERKLRAIEDYYAEKVADLGNGVSQAFGDGLGMRKLWWNNALNSYFIQKLANNIRGYDFLDDYEDRIFEGNQGILLDAEHGVFPNVTYASTTSKNAMEILKEVDDSNCPEIYYVTRCYLTRHGRGPFPADGLPDLVNNEEETNVHNTWQEDFRVAELDYSLLRYALKVDEGYSPYADRHLVVTCMDQRKIQFQHGELCTHFDSIHYSYSPDSQDFREIEDEPVMAIPTIEV